MARKRRKPDSNRDERGNAGVLARLSSGEAASVLKCLLHRHPELQLEAEATAEGVLSDVSFPAVADDVESAVLQFDYDDLNDRAGHHSWGYVEPTEAAWELLEEAVEPFVEDMKRYLDLGLEEAAQQTCKGILWGLYRVRHDPKNDILNWAPDFPGEAAGHALEVWRKAARPGGRADGQISPSFVDEYVPEWTWVLKPSEGSR